jgi:diguanylate cyclase (GGDEF)-like protein
MIKAIQVTNILTLFRPFLVSLFFFLPAIVYSASSETNNNPISKASHNKLDYFDPIAELKTQTKGEDFYKLYLETSKNPQVTIDHLSSSEFSTGDNIYYIAIKYRILYKAYIALGKRNEAYQLMQTLELYADQNDIDWLKGDSLMWQSTYLLEQSKNEPALTLLSQAILLAKSSNYLHLEARSLNIKAIIYTSKDDNVNAVNTYFKAIAIFKKLNDLVYLSKVYNNLSIIYINLKQWTQAGDFLVKALDLYKKNKSTSTYHYTSIYLNLAIVSEHIILSKLTKHIEKNTSRLDLINIAANYANKSGSDRLKVGVMVNHAGALVKEGLYEEAKTLSMDCIEQVLKHQFIPHLGTCYRTYANTLIALNNIDEGFLYLQKSLAVFESINALVDIIETYKVLAKEYAKQEKYFKAYTYQKKYIKMLLKQMDTKRNNKINILQAKFEHNKQQQEIKVLNLSNSLQQSTLAQKKMYEVLWILLAVLLLAIAIIALRRYIGLEKRFSHIVSKNKELYRDSFYDQLTNLYNRRYLDETLNNFTGSSSSYALIVLDIDYFKNVNDSYGHDYGDEVLKAVAEILKNSLRDGDFVFRFGGEEFVLLIAAEQLKTAKIFSERIRWLIASTPVVNQGISVTVTASFGVANIATADNLSKGWSDYFKQADLALYKAKDQGRDRVVAYQEIHSVINVA